MINRKWNGVKWRVVNESSYLIKSGETTVAIVDWLLCGRKEASGVSAVIARVPEMVDLLSRIESGEYIAAELTQMNKEIAELRQ